MITRKHLFFAIAATCLLTTFLFEVVPIKSGSYDPSLDENHDGKIDGKDIAMPALIYGTAGDPTVPVNVTNWPQTYSLQTFTLNFTNSAMFGNPLIISCGDYSRLSILFSTQNSASIGAGNSITIFTFYVQWCDQPGSWPINALENLGPSNFNATILNGGTLNSPYPTPFVTATKAPYCRLGLSYSTNGSFPPSWWVNFEIAVYLRSE